MPDHESLELVQTVRDSLLVREEDFGVQLLPLLRDPSDFWVRLWEYRFDALLFYHLVESGQIVSLASSGQMVCTVYPEVELEACGRNRFLLEVLSCRPCSF